MQDRPAMLAKGAGPPQAEVIVGQANFGKYRLTLWDESGRNPKVLAEGTNVDNIPDVFKIATSASAADKMILQWEGAIASYGGGPGQLYSVTIEVTQDGTVVPGGSIQASGQLTDGAAAFFGAVRLIAG